MIKRYRVQYKMDLGKDVEALKAHSVEDRRKTFTVQKKWKSQSRNEYLKSYQNAECGDKCKRQVFDNQRVKVQIYCKFVLKYS